MEVDRSVAVEDELFKFAPAWKGFVTLGMQGIRPSVVKPIEIPMANLVIWDARWLNFSNHPGSLGPRGYRFCIPGGPFLRMQVPSIPS